MKPQIAHVITGFKVGSFLLGIPSLALTVVYLIFRITQWMAPPKPPGSQLPKNPDAILLVLNGMSQFINGIAGAIGAVGKTLFTMLAVVSLVGLVYAVALWFTGRGLQTHDRWARGLAAVLVAGPTLAALFLLAAVRGILLLPSLLLMAAGFYSLWALWNGFAR